MTSEEPSQPSVTVADLSEGDWPNRLGALARLPKEGPIPAELHAALVGLLAAPESRQRGHVVSLLARIGPPVAPLLLAVLTDGPRDAEDERRAVVVALGRLGPVARASVPVLRKLVDDPWLGPCAQAALAAIQPVRYAGWHDWARWSAAIAAVALGTAALALSLLDQFGPLPALSALVSLCLAAGIWWTRPGEATGVWLVVVGIAVAMMLGIAAYVTGVFAKLSSLLEQR